MKKVVEVFNFVGLEASVKKELKVAACKELVANNLEVLDETLRYCLASKGIYIGPKALHYSINNLFGDHLHFELPDMHKCPYFINAALDDIQPPNREVAQALLRQNVFSVDSWRRPVSTVVSKLSADNYKVVDLITRAITKQYAQLCEELIEVGRASFSIPDQDVVDFCSGSIGEEKLYFADGVQANKYVAR